MKVLLLSDANSSHTIKWVRALSKVGINIHLMSLTPINNKIYSDIQNVSAESFNISNKIANQKKTKFNKVIYLTAIRKIQRRIKEFNPDILHSHYASSYGFIGALCNFHPYVISVWGADIYNFPLISIIHRKIMEYSLNKCDKILSTSNSMAEQIKKIINKKVEVIHFGIDTNIFKKSEVIKKDEIIIGTVKTLEEKYGIEYLIRSFKIVKDKLPNIPLKLLIVGGGSLEDALKKLTIELGVSNDTNFTGYINYSDIVKYHNQIDIYVALSIEDSESFGVAVLEASACEKPVVVSDVSGFTEVVDKNITGFVVHRKNINESADAIIKLVTDEKLRNEMGKAGRERVFKLYDWNKSVEDMIKMYKKLLEVNTNSKN